MDPHQQFENLFKKTDRYDGVIPYLECQHCAWHIHLPPFEEYPGDESLEKLTLNADRIEKQLGKWQRIFGCTACGHVATYFAQEVKVKFDPWHSREQRLYPDAIVYLVQFSCGEKRCLSRFSIHVSIDAPHERPISNDEHPAVAALRSGAFDGKDFGCGHRYRTILAKRYIATRLTTAQVYEQNSVSI